MGNHIITKKHNVGRAAGVQTIAFWLRFVAYGAPLCFLGYVVYLNAIPANTLERFVIDVGSQEDTSGLFRLEPSRDLGERKTTASGLTFRELDGVSYAVFHPATPLTESYLSVQIDGAGVNIVQPQVTIDPTLIKSDYNWDFSQNKSLAELGLSGTAFPFDNSLHFDGNSRVELASSTDLFEEGSFSIYLSWTPRDNQNDFQQIVGHYNWEILQNREQVSFQIGRTNDAAGSFYNIDYPVGADFFNKLHTALAVYNPASATQENGYIELYIDGNFVYRTYLGKDIIWPAYGEENLSLGWTPHNYERNPYFKGELHSLLITPEQLVPTSKRAEFTLANVTELTLPIISSGLGALTTITLDVTQK
jgi:hypothetical protein